MAKKDIQALRTIGSIYFLYLFLYSGLEFTVTFLMYHKFGYTSMDQAKMFLTTGVVMTVLQGSVVRRLPEAKIKSYAIFSLYLIVPAFILVGLAESSAMLYTGMILFAISTAFAVTCLTTLVSKYGNDDQKGSVLGIFRSLGALARALGPVVGSIGMYTQITLSSIVHFISFSILVCGLKNHIYHWGSITYLSGDSIAACATLKRISKSYEHIKIKSFILFSYR